MIDRELSAYGAGLGERPQLVVLNKSDLDPEPAPFTVEDERIVAVHRISCATGAGIDELKSLLFALCAQDVARAGSRRRGAFRHSSSIGRVLPSGGSSAFSARARASGSSASLPEGEELEAALRDAGVRPGSEVEIGDEVVVWEK